MFRSSRLLPVMLFAAAVSTAIAFSPPVVVAQVTSPAPVESATVIATPIAPPAVRHRSEGQVDLITPHITDSHHLELPWPNAELVKEIELPRIPPVHIGGMELDLSPTKHVVFLLFGATLASILLISAAASSRRDHRTGGHSKGFAGGMKHWRFICAMKSCCRMSVIMARSLCRSR